MATRKLATPNLKKATAKAKAEAPKVEPKTTLTQEQKSLTNTGEKPSKEQLAEESKARLEADLVQRVAGMRERLYAGNSILSLPPTEWELPRWLARNALTALSAPPKTGKSFIALHLAYEAATGGSFAGLRFEAPLRVMYCAFEKYPDTRDRLEAIEQREGTSIPSNLKIYAPKRAPNLGNASQVEELMRLFSEEQPQLVIIDTLARCTAGIEENSAKEIGAVIETLDKLRVAAGGCALLIVHHEGKDSSKGMRGSSALLGAVDQVIKVSGTPGIAIEILVTHSNAAEPPAPVFYKVTTELLPPAPGRVEKREVGVLEASNKPAIGTALSSRVIDLLNTSYPEGATRSQIVAGLGEDLKAGEVAPSEKTVGAALTQMSKEPKYNLTKSGSGRATRWHYLPEPAEREEGGSSWIK